MKRRGLCAFILFGLCGAAICLAPLPDPLAIFLANAQVATGGATRKVIPLPVGEPVIWHAHHHHLTKEHEALDWLLPLGPR